MSLSDELAWRGLIKDKTFKSNQWLDKPQVFYHGIDVSADSLHIGNLAPLLVAKRLVDNGWKAVLLVGGATSLVGDPGGKVEERELINREEVQRNAEAIKKQVSSLFSGKSFTLVDNYQWFSKIKYLDFLRDYGKRFPMSELMQREFVTERMGKAGKGISYAEFSYGLVQGYDFYRLNSAEVETANGKVILGAVLQIGGSDQWSNMLMGVSMIRKKAAKEAHAFSIPLVINKATGVKFGKSESGTVWLNPRRTSPVQFYQFWVNVEDADVGDFLKIFTELSKAEIDKIMAQHKKEPNARLAQIELAKSVTKLVHDAQALQFAQQVADFLTGKTLVSEADDQVLKEIRQAIPALSIHPGSSTIETLVKAGLAASNSEARRLMQSGAIYIDGQSFNKPHLEASEFKNSRLMLRRGKAFKDSALIELI